MQKLMKNWIFTLTTAIVLALLALLMILDGAGVADRFFTQSIIHEITAVFIIFYIVLVLGPMIPRYQRLVRYFALAEIALLALVVLGVFVNMIGDIRWIEKWVLCSVVGFAIWLRSAVEMINAYLRTGTEEKRMPLWRFGLYILIAAVGVWQMADPFISNRYLIFPIAVLTLLIAAGLGILTVRNRKKRAPKSAAAEDGESTPEEQAEPEQN